MILVFYILGIIISIFRLPMIYRWGSIYTRSLYINKWEKITERKYIVNIKDDFSVYTTSILLSLSIIWIIVGILISDSNWILFLSILVFTIIISIFRKIRRVASNKIGTNRLLSDEGYLIPSWVSVTTNTLLIILIVINYFYLNINFINYIQW